MILYQQILSPANNRNNKFIHYTTTLENIIQQLVVTAAVAESKHAKEEIRIKSMACNVLSVEVFSQLLDFGNDFRKYSHCGKP